MTKLLETLDPHHYALLTRRADPNKKYAVGKLPCKYHYYADYKSYSLISGLFRLLRLGVRLVRDFQYDSILVTTDKGIAMLGGYLIVLLTRIPLDLFVFDVYRGNQLNLMQSFIAFLLEPLLFRRARYVFTAGAGNYHHYHRLFPGCRFVNINNPVNLANLRQPQTQVHPAPWRLVFTGSIYWAQQDVLEGLINSISSLPHVKLLIYSSNRRSDFSNSILQTSPQLDFLFLPHSQINQAYEQADVLILPMSFGARGRDIITTAMPGKLSDYLISGVPILVIAPPHTFINHYAKEHQFGLVVDTLDETVVRDAIERLTQDEALRQRLIMNAQILARNDFDLIENRQKFIDTLFKN